MKITIYPVVGAKYEQNKSIKQRSILHKSNRVTGVDTLMSVTSSSHGILAIFSDMV